MKDSFAEYLIEENPTKTVISCSAVDKISAAKVLEAR